MRWIPLLLLMAVMLSFLPSSNAGYVETEIDFYYQEIPASAGDGFEPHIIAGPRPGGEGEVYYIDSPNGLGSQESGNVWRSFDHGVTWQEMPKPLNNLGASGDSYTAIMSDGDLYFTDLYGTDVEIAVSTDAGETWFQNPLGSSQFLTDRQWFAVGPTIDGLFGMNEETLYLIYNSATGLWIDRFRYRFNDPGFIKETTFVTDATRARDTIAVDQNDGTIYLPNHNANGVEVFVSTDGSLSFDKYDVTDATDVQSIFVDVAVDTNGTVYITWSTQQEIMLARSLDKGQNWDLFTVTNTTGTRVLPWVAAGGAGRIGLTWYETPMAGQSDDLDANWSLHVALCVDAMSDDLTFHMFTAVEDMHVGSIATQGFGATSDRDLGDFFNGEVDSKGRLIIVSGRDDDDGVNVRNSRLIFMRQREGPWLLPDVGPEAQILYNIDELMVTFDASESFVRDEGHIISYEWDLGDGRTSNGSEVKHEYRKGGTYYVTLTVTDSEDRISRLTLQIDIKEKDETVSLVSVLAALLVIAAILAFLFLRNTGRLPKRRSEGPGSAEPIVEVKGIDGTPQEAQPPTEPPSNEGLSITGEDETLTGVQSKPPPGD